MKDVASRLANRIQLTTDGHHMYLTAVREAFGFGRVDFAQLAKSYGQVPDLECQRRYSPPAPSINRGYAREGSDEKLAGVKVTLIDYKGDKAIQTVSDGPIFFANPAPGRWIIEAELDGETQTERGLFERVKDIFN
jgi:hypothetical protein